MGGGYYSVGFFEEFILGAGAGQRVSVTVGIVSLEELVQGGGYVGHLEVYRKIAQGSNIIQFHLQSAKTIFWGQQKRYDVEVSRGI